MSDKRSAPPAVPSNAVVGSITITPPTGGVDSEQQALEQARRAKGGKNRGQKNIERDRRIHDAAAAGKTPKQIALDEKLSPSIVYRVLRKPCP